MVKTTKTYRLRIDNGDTEEVRTFTNKSRAMRAYDTAERSRKDIFSMTLDEYRETDDCWITLCNFQQD